MNISIHPNLASITPPNNTTSKEKTGQELKALRESCREFEAIFIQQMYKAMRKTVPDDGLFQKDNATEIYQDMLDTQMARETAKGKGTGIGEKMYVQMKHLIENRK
jgi:peptidoglycan hydrolase FlgJ